MQFYLETNKIDIGLHQIERERETERNKYTIQYNTMQ